MAIFVEPRVPRVAKGRQIEYQSGKDVISQFTFWNEGKSRDQGQHCLSVTFERHR